MDLGKIWRSESVKSVEILHKGLKNKKVMLIEAF